MRICTSLAPASRIICTIFTEVVPRTTLSSISTMRLPLTCALVGAVLELHAELADALLGLDEGAADIVIADDAVFEGDAGALRIADGRGHAGIGNGDDDVGVGRSLARQLPAHLFAHFVDRAAADDGVWPGEIDVFEDAEPRRIFRHEAVALEPLAGDHHHLAVLDLAHEIGADDVERAGLGREHPGLAELAEHERPDAVRDRARRRASCW